MRYLEVQETAILTQRFSLSESYLGADKEINQHCQPTKFPPFLRPPPSNDDLRHFILSSRCKKAIFVLVERYAVLIDSYRRFGTFRFHLQGVDCLTDWMSPATSVNNYQITAPNIPEERRSRIKICLLLSLTPSRLVYRLIYANVCLSFWYEDHFICQCLSSFSGTSTIS